MSNQLLTYLNNSIKGLLNIGDKRAALFAKIGLKTYKDILFHIPYNYLDRGYSPAINDIQNGDLVTLVLEISDVRLKTRYRSKMPNLIYCQNSSGSVNIIYFNKIPPYIMDKIKIGQRIIVSGIANIESDNIQMVHPDYFLNIDESYKIPKVDPVYHLTNGITSKIIAYMAKVILQSLPIVPEWLPQDLYKKHALQPFAEAMRIIHQPVAIDEILITRAKNRLKYDEIMAHQICLKFLRNKIKSSKAAKSQFSGELLTDFLKTLPFKLTAEQNNVLEDITADQRSSGRMLRLLMGDVGCGKTIVALGAALNAVENGQQVAFLVPTEILAQQHFKSLNNFLANFHIKVELLISNLKAAGKRELIAAVADKKINILVGTHALFQAKVEFADLGLVIIDEQHRFGVEQRLSLLEKGHNCDLLMLSATPIPRTLSMLNFGDMDISIIKNKPNNDNVITTKVMSLSKINELIDSFERVLANNGKVYWVCPLISESEKVDLGFVEESFRLLHEKFPNDVAMLHGKISTIEKDDIMQDFKSGKKRILVATTVIEVGIDVPEATVMVVENAERFGLSQLHQLRGRVGRGAEKSFCILLHGVKLSLEARQRLAVMRKFSNGFDVAQQDLSIRGGGDYLGVKQSGEAGFKFFEVLFDAEKLYEVDLVAQKLTDAEEECSYEILLSLFNKKIYLHNGNAQLV